MARPRRIQFPGAVYHVTSRGNARGLIYQDRRDRQRFLDLLAHAVDRFDWRCHAYCLMDNHYHLLVETLRPTLADGMRHLNGVYTQGFNRAHQRVGHVFQGRYQAVLIEKESHLLEVCRYVVLNPVRAGMVTDPGGWPWSSYGFTAGRMKPPAWLITEWILRQFAGNQQLAQQRYRQFVAEGLEAPSPWRLLHGQIFLGSEAFRDRFVDEHLPLEIPRPQRQPTTPPLNQLHQQADRTAHAAAAYRHGYRLWEIASYFGVHYSTVSRWIQAARLRQIEESISGRASSDAHRKT